MRFRMAFGVVLIGAVLAGGASAAVGEVGLVVGRASGDGVDIDTSGLFGRWYFGEQRDADAPLDLQPFFQTTNFVEVDYQSVASVIRRQNAAIGYHVGDFGLAYHVRHIDFFDTTYLWALDLNYNVMDNLRVSLPGALIGFFDSDDGDFLDTDFSLRSARIDYLHRLQTGSLLVGGQWIERRVSDIMLVQRMGFAWQDVFPSGTYLEVRHYPEPAFGYGGILHINTDGDIDALHLGSSWWTGQNLGLSAGLTFYFDDHFELSDTTALHVGLSARF